MGYKSIRIKLPFSRKGKKKTVLKMKKGCPPYPRKLRNSSKQYLLGEGTVYIAH